MMKYYRFEDGGEEIHDRAGVHDGLREEPGRRHHVRHRHQTRTPHLEVQLSGEVEGVDVRGQFHLLSSWQVHE